MADYILTYTKTRFYPLNPRKEDIKIEDIAHSLSLMTRANGHHKHFFRWHSMLWAVAKKPSAGAIQRGFSLAVFT